MKPNLDARPLVVGAAGQVGKVLLRELGPRALPAGRTAPTPGWLQVDLTALAHDPSAASVLNGLNLSAIYCVGGATDVERCESDTAWAMETNCDGPIALARATKGIPFVFFSTEYVFDGRESPGHPGGPYTETDPTNPISIYGRSKFLGEQGILAIRPDALIVRTTVVYGPDTQQKNYVYTIRRLLTEGKTLRVPVDQVSSPTYNEDLARATIALLEAGRRGIFNVCGPDVLNRYEFAQLAAAKLRLDPSLLLPVPTADLNQRAPRPLAAGLLTDKLRATLPRFRMRTNAQAIDDWIAHESSPTHPIPEASKAS